MATWRASVAKLRISGAQLTVPMLGDSVLGAHGAEAFVALDFAVLGFGDEPSIECDLLPANPLTQRGQVISIFVHEVTLIF